MDYFRYSMGPARKRPRDSGIANGTRTSCTCQRLHPHPEGAFGGQELFMVKGPARTPCGQASSLEGRVHCLFFDTLNEGLLCSTQAAYGLMLVIGWTPMGKHEHG